MRFPITFPVSLSPANYRVNIPIRPGRHIRRIRQLLSVPLILMLDEMLNSNLVRTLSLTPIHTHEHQHTQTRTHTPPYLVLAWLSHQPVFSVYTTLSLIRQGSNYVELLWTSQHCNNTAAYPVSSGEPRSVTVNKLLNVHCIPVEIFRRDSVWGFTKGRKNDISKVKNWGEDKRQQGMKPRRKGGETPKIDCVAYFSSISVAPTSPQCKEGREAHKLSKFQRAKVLTKSGPRKHCSMLCSIFLWSLCAAQKLPFFPPTRFEASYRLSRNNVAGKHKCATETVGIYE